MSVLSTEQTGNGITAEAWAALLARLAVDLKAAGKRADEPAVSDAYELLRRKLTEYFRAQPQLLKRRADSESLVDKAIDRLAHKLLKGTEIANLMNYAYGIARLLALEIYNRHPELEQEIPDTGTSESVLDEWLQSENDKHLHTCLHTCLKSLSPEDAQLMLRYYQTASRQLPKQARKALAEEFGVPYDNLRLRVHRCKPKLLKCLQACLAKIRSGRV